MTAISVFVVMLVLGFVAAYCAYDAGYVKGRFAGECDTQRAVDGWRSAAKKERTAHDAEIADLKKRYKKSLDAIWQAMDVAIANETEVEEEGT